MVKSYRTKYFTGLLDSSLNIVSSDESFNDLVNSGSLAVFPIGHGRFVAYIPSSGGGIYEYGTGGLEKVAAIDGMMSPSNVNCILSLHDRASNRIMFACPSPAVADNMLIYDTAKTHCDKVEACFLYVPIWQHSMDLSIRRLMVNMWL